MNIKLRKGKPNRFFWSPEEKPLNPPELSIRFPSGPQLFPLSALRADVAVSAVGADGQTLTLADAVGGNSRGLVGSRGGAAWLDLGSAGIFAVQVLTFTETDEVYLSEPLPHTISGASGTLSWNLWSAELTALEVGSSTLRGVPWSIDWIAYLGEDYPNGYRYEEGLLDIVRRPFETGLTGRALVERYSFLASQVPTRQSSWQIQVEDALGDLVDLIRDELPTGRYEDDVDGHPFQHVHSLLTLALIVQGHQLAGYDRSPTELLDQADDALQRILKRGLPWVDINDDGVVDDNEIDTAPQSRSSGLLSCHVLDPGWEDAAEPRRRSIWEDR